MKRKFGSFEFLQQNVEASCSNNKMPIGVQNSNIETSNFLNTIKNRGHYGCGKNCSEVTGDALD